MPSAHHPSSDALTSKPLALRVMPMPADLNPSGDVFGGWIMAMVDVAGALPAIRRAGSRVVTVAVNSFVFKQPISVGDVVSFRTTVGRIGRTSITINIDVIAERGAETIEVTTAEAVFVGVDLSTPDRKPVPLLE